MFWLCRHSPEVYYRHLGRYCWFSTSAGEIPSAKVGLNLAVADFTCICNEPIRRRFAGVTNRRVVTCEGSVGYLTFHVSYLTSMGIGIGSSQVEHTIQPRPGAGSMPPQPWTPAQGLADLRTTPHGRMGHFSTTYFTGKLKFQMTV
jgi:hypothetical protein